MTATELGDRLSEGIGGVCFHVLCEGNAEDPAGALAVGTIVLDRSYLKLSGEVWVVDI